MHAYKLTVEITQDRELRLDLPDEIPSGYAELLLLVPESEDEIPVVEDEADTQAFREAKAEAEREGTIPLEQVKAELGL